MPTVHPTAVLEGDVELADDVVVGPNCVLIGPVRVGAGTRLVGNVYLHGPIEMGTGNLVYPFTCLGFAPQHGKFDPATPGQGTRIGDDNTIREYVTVHRAFTEVRPTTIGDRNMFMIHAHVAHDCLVGSDCVFTNAAKLGGHVEIQDRVVAGAVASVHQNCRVGRGVMISAHMGASLDVLPWFMVTGHNISGGVNRVGLRRAGASREDIEDVRWIHRLVCREGLTLSSAVEAISERADRPMVAETLRFIEGCKRGVVHSTSGQAIRGTA